jgi:hypothetical protein
MRGQERVEPRILSTVARELHDKIASKWCTGMGILSMVIWLLRHDIRFLAALSVAAVVGRRRRGCT